MNGRWWLCIRIGVLEAEQHALVAKLQQARPFPAAERILTIDGVPVEYIDGFSVASASNTTPAIVLRGTGSGAVPHPARVPRRAAAADARRRADAVLILLP
ncbi:MAG TPA: hypothetical protein VNE59_11565 [Burkholderiales bacterium]|nr:hypothetical protein [Burkholderiales bacterium]